MSILQSSRQTVAYLLRHLLYLHIPLPQSFSYSLTRSLVTMAKIRVGIIGLGIYGQAMVPGVWGVIGHLRSIQRLDEYEIVAVANSSVDSARRSIEHHGLPAETKAYGTPEDIAGDPAVDLIVVSVEVKKHFYLAKPAIEMKKNIFVEWPLGASLAEAEALTQLAAANNVKTIVGLQSRADPKFLKLKEILASNEIGTVVSSTVVATTGPRTIDMWTKGAEYYLDFKSGGNEFTIFFAHCETTT
jgi:predicted dehydrogenase